MTNEEAIRRLRDHFAIHDDGRPTPYLDEAKCKAIESLEKQIPKKPKIGFFSMLPVCPCCESDYGIKTDDYGDRPAHCTECGQAIDWSDTE